ncbi:MAG: hypothetical protein HYZ28_16510 [Myxococcales bacterium]|nr:hypothetical protein [Myxococcales bacterium]
MVRAKSGRSESAARRYVLCGVPKSSAALDRFIEENRAFIRRRSPAALRGKLPLNPHGRHHDLSCIFRALNRRYSRDRVRAHITFGPWVSRRRPRKSIKMGSYCGEARLIRIHPALDRPYVPRYFLEWIVFHEMLHHLYPARRRGERRSIHPPEFQAHERRFRDFERARRWEERNLESLLRA